MPTGVWMSEAMDPLHAWRAAGCSVTLASIRGGPAVVDPASLGADWTTPAVKWASGDPLVQAELASTRAVTTLDAADFDVLFMPGGVGCMWDMPGSLALQRLVEAMADQPGKTVAALCHGVAGLVSARFAAGQPVVSGRSLTCFTDAEERTMGLEATVPFLLESRLRALGADFQGGADWSDTVHVDDWLVTGQNPQSAATLAQAVLEVANRRLTD